MKHLPLAKIYITGVLLITACATSERDPCDISWPLQCEDRGERAPAPQPEPEPKPAPRPGDTVTKIDLTREPNRLNEDGSLNPAHRDWRDALDRFIDENGFDPHARSEGRE